MKLPITLFIALFALAACKKEAKVTPIKPPAKSPVVTVAAANNDTIPDKAIFKIKLAKDSVNSDETMFIFDKKAKLAYDGNEDGDYFQGYGLESLSSISGDGVNLAINRLPYTPGMSVALDITTKDDGKFLFKISYASNIPNYIQIWLKDTYLKDSVNLRTANYNFSVIKADNSSFGDKRFKLIIKDNTSTIGAIIK